MFPCHLVFVDVESGTIQKDFPANVYSIEDLMWLNGGTQVLTMNGSGDGNVLTVWDVQTGQARAGLRGMAANLVSWSADGKTLVASDRRAVVLWDTQNGTPRVLPGEIRNNALFSVPIREWIFSMTLNSSGSLLAVESGDESSQVQVWNIATGELVDQSWFFLRLNQLSWLGDKLLVSLDNKKIVSIWQLGDWKDHRSFDLNSMASDNLTISPDGKLVAVALAKTISIRKLDGGEVLRTWEISWPAKYGAVWSPDGRRLAVQDARELTVYDVSTGTPLNALKSGQSGFPGFSDLVWRPDSQALAYATWAPLINRAASYTTAKVFIWHLTDPKPVLIYSQKIYGWLPAYLCFSPDGRRLALAMGENGLVVIQP